MDDPDLILRNGRFVTPEGVVEGDLGVRAGRIASVGVASGTAPEVDAQGRWVMPGGVDVHAHVEQMSGMGLMNADTWESASRSAAMGGTTTVVAFAAQAKGQGLARTVDDYTARARRGAAIDHAFHMIVSDPAVADFEADLARLVGQGHRSIKLFTTYNIRLDDDQILRLMQLARDLDALVCVHAETDAILSEAKARLLAQGRTAPRDHAASHPPMAEVEAVARMCRFAEYTGARVMLFHISTAEGADVVRRAQARGVPVMAETCPHYLFMDETVLDRPGLEGAKWMCSPPQRTPADQAALWAALTDGTLSVVSSDHAPYRHDASGKLSAGPQARFDQIANGLPGLETRLPLMFDAMMRPDGLGPEAFARLTATAPATAHGLPGKGAIAPGMDADLVIWDADRAVTYGADDLHDNVGYNPWQGHRVTGWPVHVLLRGRTVMRDGVYHGAPGAGRWVSRIKGQS